MIPADRSSTLSNVHREPYVATDIIARLRRMPRCKVLHPTARGAPQAEVRARAVALPSVAGMREPGDKKLLPDPVVSVVTN